MGCPVSLTTRFSVVLRCDLALGDKCLLVGECAHCGSRFDIGNIPTLDELVVEARAKLSYQHAECPGKPALRFLCDIESEDCWFEAECAECARHWGVVPASPPVGTA